MLEDQLDNSHALTTSLQGGVATHNNNNNNNPLRILQIIASAPHIGDSPLSRTL